MPRNIDGILQDWSVITDPDPYKAPECRMDRIIGRLTQSESTLDGQDIVLGRIEAIEGRSVRTGGPVYRLGRISPQYRQYLREIGYAYNPKQPIKFKSVQQ